LFSKKGLNIFLVQLVSDKIKAFILNPFHCSSSIFSKAQNHILYHSKELAQLNHQKYFSQVSLSVLKYHDKIGFSLIENK
jgi:hypothetical protein